MSFCKDRKKGPSEEGIFQGGNEIRGGGGLERYKGNLWGPSNLSGSQEVPEVNSENCSDWVGQAENWGC